MAKKKREETTSDVLDKMVADVDESMGLIPMNADVDKSAFPAIAEDKLARVFEHAEDNNTFNTVKPKPGDKFLVYLVGGELVKITTVNPPREAFVGVFLNAVTRKKQRIFLSDYILEEFKKNDVVAKRTLISLIYEGKMPSKKTGLNDPHKWQRYYFKPEEVAKLLNG